MAEMQFPAQAPPPPGATPAATQQPAPTANLDLSKYSASSLRRMLQDLRNQRQDLADRRQSLGDTYERSSADNRASMIGRINTLDNNITRYEVEIDRVGRELAARGSGTTEQPPSAGIPSGYMDEDDAAGMAFGFSFMTLVLAVFFTRRFMMRKYGRVAPAGQPQLAASNERLERIEQAVDSIAIEVERVSENQRFMTRLMTETQLGDTIKDVRKSAELAKSAAESAG
jgi:archaellum component FlaC